MAPIPPAPSDEPPARPVFDRAALAILGTMLTLIVMLTALLVTVSTPTAPDPGATAQTPVSPHRG